MIATIYRTTLTRTFWEVTVHRYVKVIVQSAEF